MKKLTNKDIEKAIALYNIGISQKQIGAMLGVSGQLIGRYLRSNGIETCAGGWNEKRSAIKAKHEEMIARAGKGESMNAIARAMKMSVSGVAYVLQKAPSN
jgi:DNA-directed RNA polymerase specialized sigma subunit